MRRRKNEILAVKASRVTVQGGASSNRERSPDIRGEIRERSDDEELEPNAKKTLRKSRQLLRPAKIILKQ